MSTAIQKRLRQERIDKERIEKERREREVIERNRREWERVKHLPVDQRPVGWVRLQCDANKAAEHGYLRNWLGDVEGTRHRYYSLTV